MIQEPHSNKITAMEQQLGYVFQDKTLLQQALRHASIANHTTERLQSNERLEFLGDRVLGLVIAHRLYQQFPNEPEGDLSRRLAALVSRDTLAIVAWNLRISDFLVLASGEAQAGRRHNPGPLADACEAIIAALYLDGGLEIARHFIEHHWANLMTKATLPPHDPKSALQEWTQRHGLGLPTYTVEKRTGPDHDPIYRVCLQVKGYTVRYGTGGSKRLAEHHVAQEFMEIYATKNEHLE